VAETKRGRHAPESLATGTRSKLRVFLRAAGAPFWMLSAVPAFLGSTLPFWLRPAEFAFHWGRMIEAVIAVVLIHAGSDLANEYYDFLSEADTRNPNRGSLAGGSGALPERFFSARAILWAFVAFYAAGAAIGLHLNAVVPGNFILVIGIIGIAGGFFYSAPPLKFSYRGLGEITLGLCFGVLAVAGAYDAQVGAVTWQVILASLPVTFAVVLVLWVNQIADYVPDRDAGKRTMVVRLGPRRAGRGGVVTLAVLIFLSLFFAVFTASMIPLALVAVLAFGLVRTIVVVSWKEHERPKRLVEAQVSALKLHLALGAIMAASVLVAVGH
jgi:1,4-dihydroxy-2-naphthoate octaprenyltransferase